MRGYVNITDKEIIAEFQRGKFIRQITKEHQVGIIRVRKVLSAAGMR